MCVFADPDQPLDLSMKSGKSVSSEGSRSPSPFKAFDTSVPKNLLALSAIKALDGETPDYAKLLGYRQFSSPENAVVGLLMAGSTQFPTDLMTGMRSTSTSSDVSSRDAVSPFHPFFEPRSWPDEELHEPSKTTKPSSKVISKEDEQTGSQSYNCDQCDKVFSKQSSYTRHKFEHSGEFLLHFVSKSLVSRTMFVHFTSLSKLFRLATAESRKILLIRLSDPNRDLEEALRPTDLFY